MGAKRDNNRIGATLIFVRNGNTWQQQGPKLIGNQIIGNSEQGYSIALSGDGTTLLVGGQADGSSYGAAWVFVRNGTTWSQQGSKISPNATVFGGFGAGVALSADGNTAVSAHLSKAPE